MGRKPLPIKPTQIRLTIPNTVSKAGCKSLGRHCSSKFIFNPSFVKGGGLSFVQARYFCVRQPRTICIIMHPARRPGRRGGFLEKNTSPFNCTTSRGICQEAKCPKFALCFCAKRRNYFLCFAQKRSQVLVQLAQEQTFIGPAGKLHKRRSFLALTFVQNVKPYQI